MTKPPAKSPNMYGIVIDSPGTVVIDGGNFQNIDGPAIGLSRDLQHAEIKNVRMRNTDGIKRLDRPFNMNQPEPSPTNTDTPRVQRSTSVGWNGALERNWPFQQARSDALAKKPDFSDAYLKLDHARENIAALRTRLSSFLSTDFYELRIEEDADAQCQRIVFDSLHQPSAETLLIIGDIVSNLRSSLDYPVYSINSRLTKKNDNCGFPFADNERSFAGHVKSERCFGRCSTQIQNHFIEEIQAFKDGKGHRLWVLNKLRNIDKHRALIVSVSVARAIASFRDSENLVVENAIIEVTAGSSGVLLDTPASLAELLGEPQYEFDLFFHEQDEGVPSTLPAIQILEEAADEIQRILDWLSLQF